MLKNPNLMYGTRDLLVPGHLNFSILMLEKLWQYKNNLAMINGATHETITCGEIARLAMNFAVSLHRIGVRKGDVIGILSENRQEFWSALIGATSVGAVVTTFSTSYAKGELTYVMNISKPKYVICSYSTFKTHKTTLKSFPSVNSVIIFGDNAPKDVISFNSLAVIVPNVNFDEFEPVDVKGESDTLFIVYSSGTTGMPKGVMLTHLNVITCCFLPPSTDISATTLVVSPWYHVMGLVGNIVSISLGKTIVYLPKFDVDTYLKAVERYKVVQLIVVPPVLIAACKSLVQYDLSSVKLIFSGAAPLHKDSWQVVYNKFPNLVYILQGYGASEFTLGVTRFDLSDLEMSYNKKLGSVGKVVWGCTVKIVDTETQKPLGSNQQGEICVKGALLMKGYVGIEPGNDFDDEGFYKTGDVGYYDEDGYFYIADRLKELIKYNGYQVPPAELEALLLSHEAVKDVGVVGIPHDTAGEVPLAFVVTDKVVTEEELKKYVAERLSNPKHLRGGVRFIPAIPKSPSGKILRKELRMMIKTDRSKL